MATSSREMKKLTAVARAERRLRHRLEDIDWELDVLAPALQRVKELEAKGQRTILELENKSVLDQV